MNSAPISTQTKQLSEHLAQKVFGQPQVIEQLLVTVLCQANAILTGAPGLAKTTLVRNLASALGCDFKRIQFTPDLTPFDILGGDVIRFDEKNPENKRLEFMPGPIFSSFILADEINRASPRTQSALLEAMQEKQVTLNGITRTLPSPFYIFATQNPIENEGTFPLPEAQLDRFLLNIQINYPDFHNEIAISQLPAKQKECEKLSSATDVLKALPAVNEIKIKNGLLEGIVRIVRATRPEETPHSFIKQHVEYGASPRASQALVLASKALAIVRGESEVTWHHVQAMAHPVLSHRIILNFSAGTQNVTNAQIIETLLKETVL